MEINGKLIVWVVIGLLLIIGIYQAVKLSGASLPSIATATKTASSAASSAGGMVGGC